MDGVAHARAGNDRPAALCEDTLPIRAVRSATSHGADQVPAPGWEGGGRLEVDELLVRVRVVPAAPNLCHGRGELRLTG